MTPDQIAQAQTLLRELDQINLTVSTMAAMAADKVATVDITVTTSGYTKAAPTEDGLGTSIAGTRFTITVPLATGQALVAGQLTLVQEQLKALGVAG